ncbi:peptide alpha-N-acetyltransferase Nat2 [Aspergillus sclerotioniger CBS 115572]|uniref:Peptide alpha-N-acetyltransferase Nat2 n=1 Tax=Aspergillus sclerotioniger CBS 115572 TaxID=1450535 RepID=A0A317X8C3_9EURO|nr:peptide alpha-N-acetyltransferase Nat2 [Aspergillus sclerotioniger CBS 115572]PWY93827.1 peptide alpha-N-acetyltransferase Nat2 [Aspergillus sclerotioniger CBS 115572]
MSLRHSHLSRWFSQAFKLVQHAPPASTTRINSPLHRIPFGFTTRRTLTFQSRAPRSSQGKLMSGQFQQPGMFRRFFNSSRANNSAQSEQQSGSLSQRLRTLSKEYGWSALWVYLILSAVDFPICFAVVRLAGVERIGHYEHVISESVKGVISKVWPTSEDASSELEGSDGQTDIKSTQAAQEQANAGEASLWTQLALAYAVHKSLIFIRVPLTAAITPNVVKVLRHWGWDIVKGRPKGM